MTLLFGAGGHGAVVLDSMLQLNIHVRAVIDDKQNLWGTLLLGAVEICNLATVDLSTCTAAVVAIGSNSIREDVVNRSTPLQLTYLTVRHPQSIVSAHARVGEGVFINARAVVEARAEIGRFCILNTSCVVTHDCKVGDFTHIAPGAVLCGSVTVGRSCLLGANCSVLPGVIIGDNVVVGAGCIVTKNVPARSTIRCEPGRVK